MRAMSKFVMMRTGAKKRPENKVGFTAAAARGMPLTVRVWGPKVKVPTWSGEGSPAAARTIQPSDVDQRCALASGS